MRGRVVSQVREIVSEWGRQWSGPAEWESENQVSGKAGSGRVSGFIHLGSCCSESI